MDTNLQRLKPSRKKLQPGDVFGYRILDHPFRFGQVIKTDAKIGGFDNVYLLYFFRRTSPEIEDIPELKKSELLIPPVGTNRLGFSRGYFQWLGRRSLAESDLLPRHCFQDFRGWFSDEYGRQLSKRSEPCGECGLQSFRTIDDLISDALGIPQAEDSESD